MVATVARPHKTSFLMTMEMNETLEAVVARARREADVFLDKAAVLRALLRSLARACPALDLAGLSGEDDLDRRVADALRGGA